MENPPQKQIGRKRAVSRRPGRFTPKRGIRERKQQYRPWDLAARLEHRRTKEKRK